MRNLLRGRCNKCGYPLLLKPDDSETQKWECAVCENIKARRIFKWLRNHEGIIIPNNGIDAIDEWLGEDVKPRLKS